MKRSNALSITDWVAIFGLIISGFAAAFLLFELRHMDKHRDLEITMKLFEWAEKDRMRKAFRWVEKDFKFESLEKYKVLYEEDLEVSDYAYQVEAYFEETGFLVNKRFVDIDVIVDRLGSHIISNWRKLEPWIIAVRLERADNTFGEHFEILYKKTLQYMKKGASAEFALFREPIVKKKVNI
jgi:hypothetical protein